MSSQKDFIYVEDPSYNILEVLTGQPGINGSRIFSSSGTPDPDMGSIGDYWLDKTNLDIYGPKSQEDGWGDPVALGNPGVNDENFSLQGANDGDVIGYNQTTDTWEPKAIRYTHAQTTASDTWVVDHNLGAKPGGVSVVDSGETVVYGDVEYNTLNRLTLRFTAPFGGKAYIS